MIVRSLLAPFRHVWSMDWAIDTEAEAFNWKAFLDSGELVHVPTKPGGELTVFHLEPLSQADLMKCVRLLAQDRPDEAFAEACAIGLTAVENFRMPDGSALEVKRKAGPNGGSLRCTADTMKALHDPGLIIELGQRVIERSRLDPRNGQESR